MFIQDVPTGVFSEDAGQLPLPRVGTIVSVDGGGGGVLTPVFSLRPNTEEGRELLAVGPPEDADLASRDAVLK